MKSPVKLYIRVRLPDGSHPYLKPVYASNGRIRAHYAVHDGKATHFPAASYHLRYPVNGKRIWELVGNDPSAAVVDLQNRAHDLAEVALGKPLPALKRPPLIAPVAMPLPTGDHPTAAPAPEPAKTSKRPLADCVTEYVAETREHKSTKTPAAYTLSVFTFCSSKTGVAWKVIGPAHKKVSAVKDYRTPKELSKARDQSARNSAGPRIRLANAHWPVLAN